jgi:DNA primase
LRELPFTLLAQALDIDISRFRSRKGGSEWAGPCPVHQAKRNSTAFSYAQDGKFQCFSCGAKGRGSIDLCMKVRGVGFQAAVSYLEPLITRIRPPERRSDPEATQELSQVSGPPESPRENPPKKFTYEKHMATCAWLQARGFEPRTLERYGVGLYDNPARQSAYKGKVLIRIQRFQDGQVVGYLARDIRTPEERGDAPKYVVPSGLHKGLELFGAFQLKAQVPVRLLYLVESPLCVLKFAQFGLPAVSPFGWSVSPQQLDILVQLTRGVVYLPDRDKWEQAQSYAGLVATRLWCRIPKLPEGINDPEQMDRSQISAITA